MGGISVRRFVSCVLVLAAIPIAVLALNANPAAPSNRTAETWPNPMGPMDGDTFTDAWTTDSSLS